MSGCRCRLNIEQANEVKRLEAENQQLKSEVKGLRHQLASLQVSHSQPPSGSAATFELEPPQNQNPRPTWQTPDVQKFFDSAPRTEEDWSSQRKNLRLDDPKGVVEFFYQLTTFSEHQFRPSNSGERHKIGTGYELLRSYRDFLRGLEQSSLRATQLANYASFIYACLCRVAAMSKQIGIDEVDEFMNGFLKKRQGKIASRSLSNIRSAVLWPIKQATILRERGFGNRSDELFVLCGCSMQSYRKLWESKVQFAEDVTFSRPKEGEIQDEVSFSAPFLVKLIAREFFSLDQINSALQTRICQEEFDASIKAVWARSQLVLGVERLHSHYDGQGSDRDSVQPIHDGSVDAEMVDAEMNFQTHTATKIMADMGSMLSVEVNGETSSVSDQAYKVLPSEGTEQGNNNNGTWTIDAGTMLVAESHDELGPCHEETIQSQHSELGDQPCNPDKRNLFIPNNSVSPEAPPMISDMLTTHEDSPSSLAVWNGGSALTGQAAFDAERMVQSGEVEAGTCLRGHDDCQDLDTSLLGLLSYAADLVQGGPSGALSVFEGGPQPRPALRSDTQHCEVGDDEEGLNAMFHGVPVTEQSTSGHCQGFHFRGKTILILMRLWVEASLAMSHGSL